MPSFKTDLYVLMYTQNGSLVLIFQESIYEQTVLSCIHATSVGINESVELSVSHFSEQMALKG
jgi:hypothetical protein